MKKTNIFGMNRLINHDFTNAYALIVSQLDGEEFAVDDVQKAYEAIEAHDAKLIFIKSGQTKHDRTEVIAGLRDMRHQHLLSLRGRVSYSMRSPIAGEREAASVLFKWLEKEQQFLRSRSILKQAKSVKRLKHDLQLTPSLTTHLTTLNLSDVLSSLITTTSQIDENYKLRNAEQAAETIEANKLRRAAYEAMQTFVIAIEQAIKLEKGDAKVHREYLIQIAKVVTDFHSLHISNATRKKNAAQEAEANQNENPENGEQSGGGVQRMGGKPAKAGRSKTFNVKTMDGMDLQRGGDTSDTLAMNGSLLTGRSSNGGATNGANAVNTENVATEHLTGNGQVTNDATTAPTAKESTAQEHNGATVNQITDQES